MSKKIKSIADIFDLPPNILSGEPNIDLWGNKQMCIEGCKKILEYNENQVRISCKKYTVNIIGTELSLNSLTDTLCMVTGVFQSISYE